MRFLAPLLSLSLLGAAPGPHVSLAEAINICRMAFFIDPAKGKAMFEAVPDKDKPTVALICISYRQGAQDMLDTVNQEPEHRA